MNKFNKKNMLPCGDRSFFSSGRAPFNEVTPTWRGEKGFHASPVVIRAHNRSPTRFHPVAISAGMKRTGKSGERREEFEGGTGTDDDTLEAQLALPQSSSTRGSASSDGSYVS